jgi:hypothetical protein
LTAATTVTTAIAVPAATAEASKLALDGADIEIPFPDLQLFVDAVEQPVLRRHRPGGCRQFRIERLKPGM